MGTLETIQALVRNGLYYLTEHADDEAADDGFDVYDVNMVCLPAGYGRLGHKMTNAKWLARRWMGGRWLLYVA